MRKAIIAAAAAAAIAPFAVFTASSASAGFDPCYLAGVGTAGYQFCTESAGLGPAAPAGPGPCAANPALGINGTCGQQSNQPGLCALTGACAGGPLQTAPPPAAPPPAPPPPPAAAPPIPPPAAPPPPPTAPPLNPGNCSDLAYYAANELSCAQIAPPPPGWHPGMSS